MSLANTITLFIYSISDSSKQTYETKIKVFHRFLTSEKGVNDKTYQNYLESMKIEEIIESLDHYIIYNDIKSESIALHYISVVKRFFNFIYKLGMQNTNLIKSFGLADDNKKSFQFQIKQKIFNDSKLEKKSAKVELSKVEAEVLVSECDEQIRELFQENLILEYKSYPYKYRYFYASIIFKLILFTGIPYRVVRELKYNDVNSDYNTICINGYSIHLPHNLSIQIKKYLQVRKELLKRLNVKSDLLFIEIKGDQLPPQTSKLAKYLNNYIGRGDLDCLIKFALIQMLTRGINQSIIADFTKAGEDKLQYCQQQLKQSEEFTINRYLDSRLRSLETFDLL